MGPLVGDVVRVALGIGTPFSWLAWAFVSTILLLVGPVMVHVLPRLFEPPARLVVQQPARVASWLVLSLVATFVTILFLVVSIVGIPAAAVMPVFALVAGAAGYVALAWLAGDRVLRGALRERLGTGGGAATTSATAAPWVATFVGLALFRLVRLVPFVGAAAHSLIAWVGFAAVCALLWDRGRAWHRRRMPDAHQFAGEQLIEWYPDGDPEGGPVVGTGRPVQDNVRGDEDRPGSTR